jgi:hypothetical protein
MAAMMATAKGERRISMTVRSARLRVEPRLLTSVDSPPAR